MSTAANSRVPAEAGYQSMVLKLSDDLSSEQFVWSGGPSLHSVAWQLWHSARWDDIFAGCAGGQRRAADRLLAAGADLNWEPEYAHRTPLGAAGGLGTRRENVLTWLKEKGARSGDANKSE